jgi:hypothetical protein
MPHKIPSLTRRLFLPVVCFILGAIFAFRGEVILVSYAGREALGPLSVTDTVALVTLSFAFLGLTTLVLAAFPGRDNTPSPTPDEGPAAEVVPVEGGEVTGDDTEGVSGEAGESSEAGNPGEAGDSQNVQGETCVEEEHLAVPHPTVSDTDDDDAAVLALVASLKRSVTTHAEEGAEAQRRAQEAEARVEELVSELRAWQELDTPQIHEFEARCRQEANLDALRQIQEVSAASERLISSHEEARVRAESAASEAIAQAREEVAEKEAQIADLLNGLDQVRREAAADEFKRIWIALAAINATTVGYLDPMQRSAVQAHSERVAAAVKRLDPEDLQVEGVNVGIPPREEGSSQNGARDTKHLSDVRKVGKRGKRTRKARV